MRTTLVSCGVRRRRVLMLILSMWSGVSLAQNAQGTTDNTRTRDDQNIETIVVTAQREAIRRAQEIKMDAIGVVDSVSAEEAGQFPDQNIADALQRVPGVSVNRGGGGESNQTGAPPIWIRSRPGVVACPRPLRHTVSWISRVRTSSMTTCRCSPPRGTSPPNSASAT